MSGYICYKVTKMIRAKKPASKITFKYQTIMWINGDRLQSPVDIQFDFTLTFNVVISSAAASYILRASDETFTQLFPFLTTDGMII